MTTHVTSAVQAAAKAAVEEIRHDWGYPTSDTVSKAMAEIILRHVEPIVRATRDGLVAASRDLIRERTERDQVLAKLAEVEAEANRIAGEHIGQLAAVSVKLAAVELSAREMEDAARSYRDRMNSALARAEQSEALLREAQNHLDEPAILGPSSLDGRITAHLTPKANP